MACRITTCRATRVPIILAAAAIADPGAAAPQGEVALAGSTSLAVNLSQAAAEPPPGAPDPGSWWAQVNLTLWLPGLDGTIGVRDVTADVSVSVIDVLEDADSVIGLAGSLLMGQGKLGGYVGGFWSRVGVDTTVPLGSAEITSDIGILDFGLSYEVGRWPMEWTARPGAEAARDLVLVAYAGGRYTNIKGNVELTGLPARNRDEGWVDPMIGARVEVPLSPHWSLGFRGDIGGFGAASDIAWTAIGVVSWDFLIKEHPSSLQFGYIAIGDDYATGGGADRFVWDTILRGFVLNFSLQF